MNDKLLFCPFLGIVKGDIEIARVVTNKFGIYVKEDSRSTKYFKVFEL
jgi:hypothetical protein